jgi:cytochrome b pre-mRNA-processing protein 3
MLQRLSERRARRRAGAALYAAARDQSRSAVFYEAYGVADTIEGRFAMLAEHLAIVLARLGRDGEPGRALAEAVTAAFVVDMDDAMREFGIGDLAVPRKVKKTAAALYDRHTACIAAFDDAEATQRWTADLAAAMAANADSPAFDAPRFAAYAVRLAKALDDQSMADLAAGRIMFPPADLPGAAR